MRIWQSWCAVLADTSGTTMTESFIPFNKLSNLKQQRLICGVELLGCWTDCESSRARYACLLSPSDVDLPLDCPVDHDGELFDGILKFRELRI